MGKQLTFIALLISSFGYSQCLDIEKLDLGGTYMSKTSNYIPFEIKYKDSIYLDSISYPIDVNKIKKYSDFIFSKANEFIISRANEDFYKRLNFYQLEVNYPESTEIKNYADESLYELSNFDITYWLIYTYKKDKFKYAFGLEFNKNGEMISENKFPNYKKNKKFENFINPCDALNTVKRKKTFKNKTVDFIELAYIDTINSFCWLVQEKKKTDKIGVFNYSVDLYFVNANTNKLEIVKHETGTGISCGIEVKKRNN